MNEQGRGEGMSRGWSKLGVGVKLSACGGSVDDKETHIV